jgi:hypothetical protein
MAWYLGGVLAARKGVPAPAPTLAATEAQEAPAVTPRPGLEVRVYRVRGRDLWRGDGQTVRAQPHGYLVYQVGTGATQLLLTDLAGGGDISTRIDSEFLNLYSFTIRSPGLYRTPLVASDFLFHPFDLLSLLSSTANGSRPANHWQGTWTTVDVGQLSQLTFSARLSYRLTSAAGSDFDGTVADLAAELGIVEEED